MRRLRAAARRRGPQLRDLRLLDPQLSTSYPSAILARDTALVVNLEFIKVPAPAGPTRTLQPGAPASVSGTWISLPGAGVCCEQSPAVLGCRCLASPACLKTRGPCPKPWHE